METYKKEINEQLRAEGKKDNSWDVYWGNDFLVTFYPKNGETKESVRQRVKDFMQGYKDNL